MNGLNKVVRSFLFVNYIFVDYCNCYEEMEEYCKKLFQIQDLAKTEVADWTQCAIQSVGNISHLEISVLPRL